MEDPNFIFFGEGVKDLTFRDDLDGILVANTRTGSTPVTSGGRVACLANSCTWFDFKAHRTFF